MGGYAELHCHSGFSFLDGASEPEELVAEAARRGLDALALTDHHGFYGVVRFANAARSVGLPTVFGAEVTIGAPQSRTGVPDPQGEHLILLAKNPEGYARLSRLLSHAHLRGGKKGLPHLELSDVAVHHGDSWWVLTGCRKGPLTTALESAGPRAARRRLDELMGAVGRENLAVEIWDHGSPLDSARNDELALLATATDVALVATNNVHYATQKSFPLYTALAATRARATLDEMEGWLPGAPSASLRSYDEQRRRFRRWPGSVEMAGEIGRAAAFDLRLVAPNLPDFPCPEGMNEHEWLTELTRRGALERYGPRESERVPGAWAQIDYELEVIQSLGFAGYFLIVHDITEFCRAHNIYCQGRGSAANSAVCYSLGITNADAVALGLLFERFLSAARDGPPDIDVDIESGRREEAIQYVYERYGRHHAAQVANVITYRSRSALRDMSKVFGEEISRKSEEPIPPLVAQLTDQILHRPRHLGIHSCGMVLCDRPVIDVCPVEWGRMPGRSVLQWDKEDCAAIGLVKFDLLGLGMLEALHRMVDLMKSSDGVSVDLAHLPQEDVVYDAFCAADTVGVFQVESRAQMGTLPRVQPRCFYDLVIEVALIRPGPIQGNAVNPYIRRRRGEEPVTYLHPLLEPILKRTLGVPLFQEQLMEMAVAIAGFSATDADELRQAMASKRSEVRMEAMRERLYRGMKEQGVDDVSADKVYDALAAFANFGFPESHSVSFAHLVYCSMWFKVHYPAAFFVGLLNSQPMGFWSPQSLLADAKRHGVEVRRPDIQWSSPECTLEEGLDDWAIRLGLKSVRGLGSEAAQRVSDGAPWKSQEDLVRRAGLTKAQLEVLSVSGALDEFHPNRRSLLWTAGAASQATPDRLAGIVTGLHAPDLVEASAVESVADDLWALGITPDRTALSLLRPQLDERGVLRAVDLESTTETRVLVAGAVTPRQHPGSAHGAVFLNLEDETGHINVVFSKGAWERWKGVARHQPALLIRGRLERAQGVMNIVAERVEPLVSQVPIPASRDFR